jgi:hypothetical protein
MGHWALAVVQKRYWGLPWWSSKVVFLSNGGFEKGEEYFIDGDRSRLVSYFAPVVEIGNCNRTSLLKEADINLRVLHDGPPKSGVRIIGRVVHSSPGRPSEFVPGMKVAITGPEGTEITTSDMQGVYDLSGVAPGHYSLDVPSESRLEYLTPYSQLFRHDLKAGEVWGETLAVK